MMPTHILARYASSVHPLRSLRLRFRLQKRIGTRHHAARARLTGREIAAVWPFTARGNRIYMTRNTHGMHLYALSRTDRARHSIQTDIDERWFLSV